MRSLFERLRDFIQNSSLDTFDDLAFALFEFQFSHSSPYRRLCESEGMTPNTVTSWKEIPAAPAQAFRLFDLSCVPLAETVSVFYSSGTTAPLSSKHWMSRESLSIYEVSLKQHFFATFTNKQPLWALASAPDVAPHSSLSHMLGTLGARSFASLNLLDFAIELLEAANSGLPLTLFGTAFGLAELMELNSFQLPAGSRIIETGGFKGRRKEIPRAEFYAQLAENFSVSGSECYSEYGMCEMASQFYSAGVDGALYGPQWVRSLVIDPITGGQALVGSPGLLRHFDLANLNSVCAIQTQDRAIELEDGSFRLLGRATDSELRGCSLTAEELWSN